MMMMMMTAVIIIIVTTSLLPYICVCQADRKLSHPICQNMQSDCSIYPLRKEFKSVHKMLVFKTISHANVTHRSMRAIFLLPKLAIREYILH
jgi:hypothetical protein